jgi:rhamnosyltransferase
MKVVAVVILYNPGDEVIENISSYIDHVEKLYVIDNSEKADSEIKNNINSFAKAVYIQDGENKGIAIRLNQACRLALEQGFEWLLTMDQDSYFSKKYILRYLNCFEELPNKGNVAMTGVEVVKENGETGCAVAEVPSLITSGSIINLRLYTAVGPFDEALFIDQVDLEYCYRALLKGYKVIQFKNVFLQHSLGSLSTHTSFKNFKNTYRSLHSPIRLYYMVRNYLYIKSRYQKSFPDQISLTKKDVLIRIKNNLFYNSKKFEIVKFIFWGIIDFKSKKMGKLKHL